MYSLKSSESMAVNKSPEVFNIIIFLKRKVNSEPHVHNGDLT